MKNKQVLILSPHVDDELLGCFSYLNKNTHVMECGADEFHVVDRKERLRELQDLADHCKFTYEVFDNIVNNYVLQDLIEQITGVINDVQPEYIFIPYPSYNQDHRVVYDAALVALRHHDINFFIKKVLVYEEPHSFLWDYTHDINSTFKPNFFAPLDIDEKIKSYNFLKSQVRGHRSPEMLRLMARFRGIQGDMENSEAFQIIRWIE